jgi:hypothetical protein
MHPSIPFMHPLTHSAHLHDPVHLSGIRHPLPQLLRHPIQLRNRPPLEPHHLIPPFPRRHDRRIHILPGSLHLLGQILPTPTPRARPRPPRRPPAPNDDRQRHPPRRARMSLPIHPPFSFPPLSQHTNPPPPSSSGSHGPPPQRRTGSSKSYPQR